MTKQPAAPTDGLKRAAEKMRKTVAQIDKLTGKNFTVGRRADVAQFCGTTVQAVDKWLSMGMPGARNAYDLHKIIVWLRTEGPWRQRGGVKGGTVEDIMIEAPESEWSEEYRKWKARLAEVDYQERMEGLMSVDRSARIWIDVVMPEVRGFAERVIQAHGNGTQADWTETRERIEGAIERELGKRDSSNGKEVLEAGDGKPGAATPAEPNEVGGSEDPIATGRPVSGETIPTQPSSDQPLVVQCS